MANTDAGEADKSARRKRIRQIKMLIIIVPLGVILILLGLCIFLGIRLHMVKKELYALQAKKETAVGVYDVETGSAADIQSTADVEQTADAPDTEEGLYTPVGVSESKRTEIEMKEPAKEEQVEGIHYVYLTFDDGPSSNTGRILDILAEYDVKATFFVVGKEGEQYQALYQRIVDEGHTLAMHSYSHKYNEIYQSVDSYAQDLTKLQEFLYDTTGVWCRFCRFPGGSSNTVSRVDMHEIIDYVDGQDISYFDWNIVSGDASSAYISPQDIVRNCTRRLLEYPEAIILMHDAAEKDSTVEALPALIETIQAMDNTRIVPITDDTEQIHHISND